MNNEEFAREAEKIVETLLDRVGHSCACTSCKERRKDAYAAIKALGARVDTEARRDFAWNLAQVLCPWCGEEGYNLVWHHNEWRHYRQYDQHVEYCQADRVYNLLPDDVLASIRNGEQP